MIRDTMPNNALHRNSRYALRSGLGDSFMVSFPLHHCRHRLWVSLGR